MSDDKALITALEAAGHQDVADHMKTKTLASELRALGRDDVAAQLENHPAAPERQANPDLLGEIVDRAHQHHPEAEQDAMAAKVTEALDRDIPSWRDGS